MITQYLDQIENDELDAEEKTILIDRLSDIDIIKTMSEEEYHRLESIRHGIRQEELMYS